jgi:crossover junction endodeoxyribonuclease RuvC
MESVVCGLDPGLSVTGYAVLTAGSRPCTVLDAGVCRMARTGGLPQRLHRLHEDVAAILREYSPSIVAVEQLYAHYAHPRTAILMGHARGVILLSAAQFGMDVRGYAATRIKRHLTGNGRASKLQVQRAIERELRLSKLPEPADVADAIAIALCCAADLLHPRRSSTSSVARKKLAEVAS